MERRRKAAERPLAAEHKLYAAMRDDRADDTALSWCGDSNLPFDVGDLGAKCRFWHFGI